jgi:2-polyprenyl-6-methoxyphenol hydroxylase-like FAD-dependent oxidoreductase
LETFQNVDLWKPFVDVVRKTDEKVILETSIFYRTPQAIPATGWGKGRVTLLGDAAHPLRSSGWPL